MELDVRTRAKPTKTETIRVSRSRKPDPDENGEPPKPLPRSARSNSVELRDGQLFARATSIEMGEDRPVAKPRTSRPDIEPELESRPWLRRSNTEHPSAGEFTEESRPVLRRANTYMQGEQDAPTDPEPRPLLRRSNTDMNEESKMRADMLESEKEQKERGRGVIQSVNPHLPVSGGYKVFGLIC